MRRFLTHTMIAVLIVATAASAAAQDASILVVPEAVMESGEPAPQPFTLPATMESAASGETKSMGRAVLYSALLPGWGHYYLGEKRTAVTFFALEAAIWTSFAVFRVQGQLREDEYESFAQTFAGIKRTGHSDDFYSILTKYNTSRDYENSIKGDGRFELFPNIDAASLDRYFEQERVADFEAWAWQSAELRRAYQDRRSASKRAYRRGVYAASAAIANRVAAVFFAVLTSRSTTQDEGGEVNGSSYQLRFGSSEEYKTSMWITRRF